MISAPCSVFRCHDPDRDVSAATRELALGVCRWGPLVIVWIEDWTEAEIQDGPRSVDTEQMSRSMNAHHAASQAAGNRESLYLLLRVIDEHTPGALEDLNRVAHFATATAEILGLSEYEMERVEIAARLHDVGKLAIPEAILTKPGPLDAAEWTIMHTHAEIGERILAAAPSLAHAAELVRSHHERYDGRGYPDRLAGEDIPIGGRIISVCAAFVAMMRHRPFSDAITVTEALAEVDRNSGSQFDPRTANLFCELLGRARV